MSAPRIRGALSLCIMLVAAACGSGTSEPGGTNGGTTTPASLSKVSGDGQTGLVGTTLSLPLSVKVTSSSGAALKGVTVNFAVTSGAASVNPASATSDSTGAAKTVVTLGSAAGTVQITATVSGTTLSAVFSATAGSGTITTACATTSPTTPTIGAVQTGVSGTGICLGGAAGGSDYALIAFNSNPDTLFATASFTVQSKGAQPLTTADAAPVANLAPLGSPLRSALGSPLTASANDVRSKFDTKLRMTARRELVHFLREEDHDLGVLVDVRRLAKVVDVERIDQRVKGRRERRILGVGESAGGVQ